MNKNEYSPILTDSTKKTFFQYIDCLDIPEIDYFAIGVQDLLNKNSISLMSNSDWQKEFTTNNYAPFDPIRKVSMKTKRNIISFSEVHYVDNFGKHIMNQRKKMGIKNGIIFMNRSKEFNYMFTLATNYSKFDYIDFLRRYVPNMHLFKDDLINIITSDFKNFILNT